MSIHNICLYKEVKKKYTGCNLKTTEFLDCALIGVCAVIRSNTVGVFILHMTSKIVKLKGYNEIPCFKYLNQAFLRLFLSVFFFFFFFFYKFCPIDFHFGEYLYANKKMKI